MPLILCRMLWVLSLIAIIGMSAAFSKQPTVLQAPSALVPYTSDDKSIHIARPSNWKPHSNSMHAVSAEVWFIPAKLCTLRVTADLQGSLMADIHRSGSNMLGSMPGFGSSAPDPHKGALEALHRTQGAAMEKLHDHYQEEAAVPTHIAGTEALATRFTFQVAGLWSSRPFVGKRFTAIASDRRIDAFYYCPQTRQSMLEPVFEQMMQSLALGQGGS